MPHDLINAKPVMAAIREFFRLFAALRSSWTRPTLSAKSPTSAACRPLGPVACRVSAPASKSATYTQPTTPRICPIETPEGPNIGLISSLSCFAPHQRVRLHRVALPPRQGRSGSRLRRRHQRGRVRSASGRLPRDSPRLTPKMKSCGPAGKRTMDLEPFSFYLSAWEEDRHTIAQANNRARCQAEHRAGYR